MTLEQVVRQDHHQIWGPYLGLDVVIVIAIASRWELVIVIDLALAIVIVIELAPGFEHGLELVIVQALQLLELGIAVGIALVMYLRLESVIEVALVLQLGLDVVIGPKRYFALHPQLDRLIDHQIEVVLAAVIELQIAVALALSSRL